MAKKPIRSSSAGSPQDIPKYNSYTPAAGTAAAGPALDRTLNERRSFKSRLSRTFLFVGLLLLAFFIFIGVWDARNISSASQKLFGSGNFFELLSRGPVKTTADGRINLLLVGYSIDDPGHPAATLTDSIILLSMNGANHSGYMLSIPRDLYVKIPGHGYGKINEAYQDGGMSLLEQIVSDSFQTPINYYALINYAAVRDSVNALGGINVNIQSSDPRGLFDPNINPHDGGPLKLSIGPQLLDGQTALNLTRARGDPCGCGQVAYGFAQSDFDRTQHQRQVLTAIKDKLNWKLVLNPQKNGRILNAVSGNVKTDIQANEIRRIFGTFNSIPSNNLKSIGLRDLNGVNYLSSYLTPYGQDALIPAAGIGDYSAIDQAVAGLN
jgi:LCP family protein required for cell wall assembly